MDLNAIPLMSAIKKRMGWLNENQRVISQNVAQADTPGYKAQELEKQSFSGLVESMASSGDGAQTLQMRTSKAGHMHVGGGAAQNTQSAKDIEDAEESPSGNTVVLEEEMMKLADNQMQYGLVTNLYKKNVGLLRTALGKGK